MASGSGYTDYRNNVIYNWGYQSLYGGESKQVGGDNVNFSIFNIVANYYKPGPATKPGEVMHRIASPSIRGEDDFGKWHIADNVVEGNKVVSENNWDGGVQTKIPFEKIKLDKAWDAMPINQQTAKEAYKLVLENAGAILPKRDAVDLRIIKEVRGGYATFEGTYKNNHEVFNSTKISGIIDTQADVGGWPELKSTPAPKDTDHDGMPDVWEEKNGLDPKNAEDRNNVSQEGYTMLEEYLNGL
jgi:pectate lyase